MLLVALIANTVMAHYCRYKFHIQTLPCITQGQYIDSHLVQLKSLTQPGIINNVIDFAFEAYRFSRLVVWQFSSFSMVDPTFVVLWRIGGDKKIKRCEQKSHRSPFLILLTAFCLNMITFFLSENQAIWTKKLPFSGLA